MLYFYLVFGSLAGLVVLFGQRAAINSRSEDIPTQIWYVVDLEKIGPWLSNTSKRYIKPLMIATLLGAGRITRKLTNAIEDNARKRIERLSRTDSVHKQGVSKFMKDVSQINRPNRN